MLLSAACSLANAQGALPVLLSLVMKRLILQLPDIYSVLSGKVSSQIK